MNDYLNILQNTKFPSHFVPSQKYYRRSQTIRAAGNGLYGSIYTAKIDKRINNIKKIDVKVSITTDNVLASASNISCFFCKSINLKQKPNISLANMQSEYLLSRKNEAIGNQTNTFLQASNTIQFDGAAAGTDVWFFINLPLSTSEMDTLPLKQLNDTYVEFYINDTAAKMGIAAGIEVLSIKMELLIDYFEYVVEPIRSVFNGYNCYYEKRETISLAPDTITVYKTGLTCKNPVYNIAVLALKEGSTIVQANVLYMKITCENETIKEMYKLTDFYYGQDLQGYTSNGQYKAWLSEEKSRTDLNGLFPTGSNAVYELEVHLKSSSATTSNFTLNVMCEYPYVYDINKKQIFIT